MVELTRREWAKTVCGGLTAATVAGRAHAVLGRPQDRSLTYPYLHLDVFTDRVLTGNQLAVFMEPAGLPDETMQSIAREMNFSETTFVWPAESVDHDARLRIFGRNRELSFAGHPTIGSAFALAETGRLEPGRSRFVFGEGIGPIPVDLEWEGGRLAFAWMTQLNPTFGATLEDRAAVASGLGVDADAIVSTGLPIQEVSCGSTFWFVPLATRQDVDLVVVDRAAMEAVFERAGQRPRGLFVFSSEPGSDGAHAYSRMVGLSGSEDPATGSASGPLGSYLVHHGLVPPAEAQRIVSVQGVRMSRPSRIFIDIGTTGSEIVRVRVGGTSVVVGEGTVVL